MDTYTHIQNNFDVLKGMSRENYEAFIVAFLIYEKEGGDNFDKVPKHLIDVYRNVYDDFLSNDYFELLNDSFDDVIEENKMQYKEQQILKGKKSREQER